MTFPLKREFSKIGLLAALGFVLAKKDRVAGALSAVALGLRYIPSTYSYHGKSVVITGGSRGLGFALATELVKEGANVTLLARDRTELLRAKNYLQNNFAGAKVQAFVCDVNEENHIQEAFRRILFRYGTIDVLINNAGSVAAGPFEAMNIEDFNAQMKIHFYAPLKAIQNVLPIFKKKGSGKIVNIASIGGKVPVPHMSSYCASKFALAGLSQTLSAELAKDKIQVTTIYPGLMRTGSPIQGVFKGDSEKEYSWFAIFDNTPGLTVSASNAAKQILNAVRAGETELIISTPAKTGAMFYANFPQIFTALTSIANRFLPQDFTDQRRTGAEVRDWLDSKAWAKPFLRIMGKAQRKFNEYEKYDAEFNLNV
jgi:short-subunit dehydrogenase